MMILTPDPRRFVFGASAKEVGSLRHRMRYGGPDATPEHGPEFQRVISALTDGVFLPVQEVSLAAAQRGSGAGNGTVIDPRSPPQVQPILDGLHKDSDWYLLGRDFPSYVEAQDAVDELYRDKEEWTKTSILSAVRMGFFSTDRTFVGAAPVPGRATCSPSARPLRAASTSTRATCGTLTRTRGRRRSTVPAACAVRGATRRSTPTCLPPPRTCAAPTSASATCPSWYVPALVPCVAYGAADPGTDAAGPAPSGNRRGGVAPAQPRRRGDRWSCPRAGRRHLRLMHAYSTP